MASGSSPRANEGIDFDPLEVRALRQSDERLRALLENSTDAVYRYNLHSGQYEYLSPRIAQIIDCTIGEISTTPLKIALGRIHADDLEEVDQAVQQAVAACQAGERSTCKLEYRLIGLNDQTRWIADRVTFTAAAGPAGATPLYRDGALRDISEGKRREAQFTKLTRLYAVLSQVNESIVRIRDASALLQEVCHIVSDGGFPLVWIGEVRGIQVVPLAWWGPASDYLQTIKVEIQGPLGEGPTGTSIREGRTVINDDFALNPSTLSWRNPALQHGFRASAAIPFHFHGNVIGALTLYSHEPKAFDEEQVVLLKALAADLSYALDAISQDQARQSAEESVLKLNQDLTWQAEQLKLVNKELESFSYSVSHDLRAPLRAVRGFSQILRSEYAPSLGPEVQHYLEIIDASAHKMGVLIEELLRFSRLSRQELTRRPVDLKALVYETISELAPEMQNRQVDISIDDLPACQADPVLLKQVLVNLLSNALKYSRKRQRACIQVGCQEINGERVYFVKDNGVGFNMRYIDKLFMVFQRLHTDDEYEGTGVGLAIVQRIIQRHGGQVWAEAEEDKGATFYFTLPGH
jgi:signal transduction histidine kinase